MKKLRRILFLALMVGLLTCMCCQPAFAAVTEEEVQAQVDAVGKEAVSGNVLIWFMCAIGFLKVSQKIDSFMASLGVNVGHTGGSMLAEALIAARGFSGFKSFSSHHFGGGHSSNSTHVNAGGGGKGGGFGAGFASGGLAGIIGRKVTNNAVKTATTPSETKSSGLGGLVGGAAGGIGGHIYTSSVSKGGNFANNVIGSVATGNITQMGTISGEKAVDALHSYMGHAALEAGAENIPKYQNVEIGGGRITGTEVTAEHPEGIAFGMYHADQYVAPEGQYTTVHSADGAAWYKQYAVDTVEKSPYMAPDGSIGRRCFGKDMVLPEMLFQKNHLILISLVTANLTNDGFFLVVAIQAAEEAAIHVHDGHVMAPLGFVVDRNSFFPVQPPVILGIVVRGFDFQNCGRTIRKFHKVVHIS